MVTLHIGSYPAIFVCDHSLAHQALVQKGALFADRHSSVSTGKIDGINKHTINLVGYGPTRRILRKNLTFEILNPFQIRRIEDVQRDLLLNFGGFNILNVRPRVTKVLFYKLWKKFLRIQKSQEDVLIPLIRARKKAKQENLEQDNT
ncbi:hypothetical protein CRYUN_Cryun16bG0048100 [Craigia yunnanensis]